MKDTKISAQPRDAAAVILLKDATAENIEFCLARRSAKLNFLPNFQAFAGGKLEKSDSEIVVKNCDDAELSSLMACAAREMFEEIGVLLVRNGETLTKGQRASLHDDLISGRMTFGEILEHWNLWLDAEDFTFAGTWTTPNFSPVRFKTRFFVAVCPPKQTPFSASGELEDVEFIAAKSALEKWRNGEILCAPPTLGALRIFSNSFDLKDLTLESRVEKLIALANDEGENPNIVEFNPHVLAFPLKTFTLPPATHTNCFIVGKKEFIVIDAASPFPEEQARLHQFIDEIIENGGVPREIIVTHLHSDHFGGEIVLQQHLREKFDLQIPISAHRLTVEKLSHITFDRIIEGDDILTLRGDDNKPFELNILHTSGHARGHLCFYDASTGFLLSSDNVISSGSVVIAPPEGDMTDYLQSLQRLRDLPNLRFLCGSHGAAIANAKEKIEQFIEHRLTREREILDAYDKGAKTPAEIVARVYKNLDSGLLKLAEKSVEAHLEKLRRESRISSADENG